jgi:hypothetical protein
MRVGRLVALAGLAMLIAASVSYAHVHGPNGIGGDKYRNTNSQHATNVEPDSFAWGNTIVYTSQVGRVSGGGAANIGFATSTDGGQTWKKGGLPGTTVNATPPGPWARISDPAVAYDPEHNVWMIGSLGIDGSGTGLALLTSRSTDGGLTWQNPITTSLSSGTFYDKNWIACDTWASSPHYGNCYVEWDDNSLGNQVLMSTSTDGGLTWSPKTAPPGTPSGLGGQPIVQPNGTVVVPYTANYSAIYAFRSLDGGLTWTTSTFVASQSQANVDGGLRDPPLPSAEVDSAGRVYVAWHDCAFRSPCTRNDIVYSSSTNGTTWTAKTRVPIDLVTSASSQFLPGIGVDPVGPPGRIGIVYYYYPATPCTAATCQLTVGFISSGDSGATWHAPQTLSPGMNVSWVANSSQGRMVGDYFSTSFLNHEAHPVFVIGRAPPTPPSPAYEALLWEAGLTVPLGAGPLRTQQARMKPMYRPQWLVRERAAAPPPAAN